MDADGAGLLSLANLWTSFGEHLFVVTFFRNMEKVKIEKRDIKYVKQYLSCLNSSRTQTTKKHSVRILRSKIQYFQNSWSWQLYCLEIATLTLLS